jgi:hypothetical protein
MIDAVCRRCQKPFTAKRADANYCSVVCRVAAHRRSQRRPVYRTAWLASAPKLSERRRPGTDDLSRAELGRKLVEISQTDDDGQPKTGRRFYYLALSHGYIRVDMSDTPEGKKSRDKAYKRVTEILGILRMAGDQLDETGFRVAAGLDWSAVLDLTRELDQWRMYASPREAREHLRRTYNEDRWLGQSVYPIHIVEKDTLEPICQPIASRWQMPFASSRLQFAQAPARRRRHAAASPRQDLPEGGGPVHLRPRSERP